jgi:hypothetical protein
MEHQTVVSYASRKAGPKAGPALGAISSVVQSFNHGTKSCQLPEDIPNILKAPTAKNPNPSGLGRAIINRRAKDARQTERSGLVSCDRISIAAPQPCLLVHDRHRSLLSSAVCHPRKGSRRFLEYGTISRHRIHRRLAALEFFIYP